MEPERVRGILGAFAMARPRRSPVERGAVEQAFAAMPQGLSRSARAAKLAERVAAELVRAAEDRGDEMAEALARALVAAGDPVATLARSSEIGLHVELERLRVERFMARGCSWIDAAAWSSETEALQADLATRLAARFRRR